MLISAIMLVPLSSFRGLGQKWSTQYGGESNIDPAFDVLHDQFLVYVVEKVMKASFVEFQSLVSGTDHVVKVLAAAGPRVLVEDTVENQDWQRDQRKIPLETVVSTDHRGHSL